MDPNNLGRYIYFFLGAGEEATELRKYVTNNNTILKTKNNKVNLHTHEIKASGTYFAVDIDDLKETLKFLLKNFPQCCYFLLDKNFDKEFARILLEENRIELIEYLIKKDAYPHYHYPADNNYITGETNSTVMVYGLLTESIHRNGVMLDFLFDTFHKSLIYEDYIHLLSRILMIACKNGDLQSTSIILGRYAKYFDSPKLYCAAVSAIETGLVALLDCLVNFGFNLGHYKNHLLSRALIFDQPDIADYLILKGASIESLKHKDFVEILKKNNINSMQWLFIQFEFQQEQIDNLFMKCHKNSVEMVELFVNQGANVKKYGKKLLGKVKKNKEMVEYLNSVMNDE